MTRASLIHKAGHSESGALGQARRDRVGGTGPQDGGGHVYLWFEVMLMYGKPTTAL